MGACINMISIVTTAYNHHDTLKRAIDSVQSQIGVKYEHIIIDAYEAIRRAYDNYKNTRSH